MKLKIGKEVKTDYGEGIVLWIDEKGETAHVLLHSGSKVSVLTSELKPIKRYKLLRA